MDWLSAGQQLWQRKTLQISEIFICHGGVIPHLQISVILAAEDGGFRDLFSSRASPDSASCEAAFCPFALYSYNLFRFTK